MKPAPLETCTRQVLVVEAKPSVKTGGGRVAKGDAADDLGTVQVDGAGTPPITVLSNVAT